MTTSQEHPISVKVQISRLDLLFKQSLPTIIISLLVVTIAGFGLQNKLDARILMTWLGSVVGLSVARALFLLAYLKIKPEGEDILKWELPYFLTLMGPVTAWGVGGAWAATYGDSESRFLIMFLLLGMAGGAQGAYSAVRYMLLACAYTLLLPITLVMLLSGETTALCIAFGALLYALSLPRNSRVLTDSLTDARRLQFQLADEKAKVERLAMYDFLTGLHNRRAFEELSGATLKAARIQRHCCHLMMIDIDHFKTINDSFGHGVGDLVLKQVASELEQAIRPSDLVARFGGEEFIVFLPNTQRSDALDAAERLRACIETLAIKNEEDVLNVTISIGISGDLYDLNELIGTADKALYESKRGGRNRVTFG